MHQTLIFGQDVAKSKDARRVRGTQRQFSENICSEDDLRSRIFGTFVVKFLACLPLLGFSNILKLYNYPFLTDFDPKKGHPEFLFLWDRILLVFMKFLFSFLKLKRLAL